MLVSSGTFKILVADDHALMRTALRQLLTPALSPVCNEKPGLEFVEANDFGEVLAVLAVAPISLLLTDLVMPGMEGAASLRLLRERYPETKVAVVSGRQERTIILDCLAAGVHGYIPKTSRPERILKAVELVLGGQVYVPPLIANVAGQASDEEASSGRPVFGNDPRTSAGGDVHFTSRQRDVLRYLGQGRSTKEIARGLGLGLGTIKVHLAAIYRQLNARSRTEAVLMASRLQL